MISAEKAMNCGERVTLDFHVGGLGVAYVLDGDVYEPPGVGDTCYKIDGGFNVIRDGGELYDSSYSLDVDENLCGPAAEGR